MSRRIPVLGVAIVALLLGTSVLTSSTKGSMGTTDKPPHLLHVRGEYFHSNVTQDRALTTCILVNRSVSRTIWLGDVLALGTDGLTEVLATHTGLNGVALPPLATIELVVDSIRFPGLLPERGVNDRGLATCLVEWWGPKDALRLTASVFGEFQSAQGVAIKVIEGHVVEK
jgi:hypothetical protein